MTEIIAMSMKELERLKILSQVKVKKMTQNLAAKKLGISDRQVRNLLQAMRLEGDSGLISKKRGKLRNHSFSSEIKDKALSIVNSNYSDFGPKLASEYLNKHHNIVLSKETLRKWMIERGMWYGKIRKKNLHLLRERRRVFGELIQIDGSHHYWFEDRGPKCVLMVFIDDATSMITSLHLSEKESLEAYYQAFYKHLISYGIPLSLYGDHCSVLVPRCLSDENKTQFNLAMKELGCKLILANSPQAKGRVERANQTLQDRLVKYLRVKNISTIEEANKALEEYRLEHNLLFSKKPSEQDNAHRSLDGIDVNRVLCTRYIRTLNRQNVLQFENTFYQIFAQDVLTKPYYKGKVEIRIRLDGNREAFFNGKKVVIKSLKEAGTPIVNEKEIKEWKDKKRYIPPVTHPYKRSYNLINIEKQIFKKAV